MPAEKAGREAEDVSESTQTRSGFQGQGCTNGAARRRDGGGAGGPFRGSSPPDLRLEEGANGCGAQGLRRPSGTDRRVRRAQACRAVRAGRPADGGTRFFVAQVRGVGRERRLAMVERQGPLSL